MSSIIERAFDSSKKILRAVYKGAPNLFTTSDLNRQFENIDYRLSFLEDSIGVKTDMYWEVDRQSGNLKVYYKYLEIHGCLLHSGGDWMDETLSTTSGHTDFRSFKIWYTTAEVTYDTDPTHLISGATFVDGSTKPSANQIVIDNWGFSVNGANVPTGAKTITLLTQADADSIIIQYFVPKDTGFAAYVDEMRTKVMQEADEQITEALSGIRQVFTFDNWGANSNNHYAKLAYCAGVWVLSIRLAAFTSAPQSGIIFSGTISDVPQQYLDKFPSSLQGNVADTEATLYTENTAGAAGVDVVRRCHINFARSGTSLLFEVTSNLGEGSYYTVPTRITAVLPLLG